MACGRPDNYIDYKNEGFGLWEIWWANKEGVSAPVTDSYHGLLKFIDTKKAVEYAVELAEANPEKTFKVVISRGTT